MTSRGGRHLVAGSVANVLGWASQVILNLVLVRVVVRQLGLDAFGLYALVLSLVGYFAITQGLNQATLKFLASDLAVGEVDLARGTVQATLGVSMAIGVLGGLAVAVSANALAREVFEIPVEMQDTAVSVFRLTALGIFPTTVGMTLAALPQSVFRYDLSNGVVLAVSVVNLGAALLAVALGSSLFGIVAVAVGSAWLSAAGMWIVAQRLFPSIPLWPAFRGPALRRIASFGALSFLSSIVSTATYHLDRFFVAAVGGAATLGAYAAAQLPMTRVMTLVTKFTEVLLPESSRLHSADDVSALAELYVRTSRYVLLLSGLILVPLVVLSAPLLSMWISPELATHAAPAMSVLAGGFLVRSLGSVPSVLNLGTGNVKVNALFACVNFLIVAVGVYPAMKYWGLEGVASVSVLGSMNTLVLVAVTSRRLLAQTHHRWFRDVLARPLFVLGAYASVLLPLRTVVSPPLMLGGLATVAVLVLALAVRIGVVDLERLSNALRAIRQGRTPAQ